MAEAAWGLPAQCGGHRPPVPLWEDDRLATLFHLPGPCVTSGACNELWRFCFLDSESEKPD